MHPTETTYFYRLIERNNSELQYMLDNPDGIVEDGALKSSLKQLKNKKPKVGLSPNADFKGPLDTGHDMADRNNAQEV